MQVHNFETKEYFLKSNVFIFIAVYQEYIKEKVHIWHISIQIECDFLVI